MFIRVCVRFFFSSGWQSQHIIIICLGCLRIQLCFAVRECTITMVRPGPTETIATEVKDHTTVKDPWTEAIYVAGPVVVVVISDHPWWVPHHPCITDIMNPSPECPVPVSSQPCLITKKISVHLTIWWINMLAILPQSSRYSRNGLVIKPTPILPIS